MKIVKRKDGYWITRVPDCCDCGPYEDKNEADGDREALQNTFDNWDDPTFWSGEW